MKIEVKEQKKNPLLKREEVLVSLEHAGKATPSRKEMLPELAKVLKSKEELIIVDKIFSAPGKSASQARILLYSKKDEIPAGKLEKMKKRMAPKKAAAPAPEAGKQPPEGGDKPEAPKAEKPKEEAKPEEKKEEPPKEGE